MKPCETCKHFNMNECDYCNVEAYVEDDKPCAQYTTSCNPERLLAMLENAQVVSINICEKTDNCDISCPCYFYDEEGINECATDMLWKIILKLKRKIKK